MVILDTIFAFGHENLLCTHNTTIELTKDNHLTKKGDCILGIRASKACTDLNEKLKKLINQGKKIKVTIKYEDIFDSFYGYGDPRLTLTSKNDMVFRKSKFICDRTILINCTKSSNELNRKLVNSLKNKDKRFEIDLENASNDE